VKFGPSNKMLQYLCIFISVGFNLIIKDNKFMMLIISMAAQLWEAACIFVGRNYVGLFLP